MFRSNLFSVVRGLCFFATDDGGGAAAPATPEAPAAPATSVGVTATAKAKPAKKVASKPAKPAKKAKKAPAKKAKAAPKKKAKAAKGKKAKASNDGKLNTKQQKTVDYLGKHNANTAERAIKREKVWNACGVGMGVISSLKDKGLLERIDQEDGTKFYKLTAAGMKAVTKS